MNKSANAQVSGLDGTLQRLDEKILVLSPRNVELSCETAAGFLQEDLFSQA